MFRFEKVRRPDEFSWVDVVMLAALLAVGSVAIGQEESVPAMYVLDFLAPASEGVDINEQGMVIGNRAIDTGCDPSCVIVPEEPGVWFDGAFTALPTLPDWSWAILEGINANGWVVGTAFSFDDIRGIVWKPNGSGYDLIEIGDFPDTDFSTALGIDDNNRVVGFNDRQFPLVHKGFLWTEEGGLVELSSMGFPSATPMAISPAGTVAYLDGWYELDVPGVVHANTSPPDGFRGPGAYVAINDAGDQIRLIGPTTGQNINYPFRYNNTGEWQQIWESGGIDASPFNVGSITSNLDISLTISSSGLVAPGPTQTAELLTERLSPAYGDATAAEGGPITEDGKMVAQVTMGAAPRLVRLVPAEFCSTNCIRVERMRLLADFVDDPSDPGRCVGTAHTRAMARLLVTDENGTPLPGVEVTGHFLTVYRLDEVQTAVTDNRGSATFRYKGAPCTGTMTFLATEAVLPGYTFDRTVGDLQQNMIPSLSPLAE